ncbi:hypothetical protein H5410_021715 [Solanum commersonii]|uniref:Uncharacterized protein n=1 Tax=Solanum commersonii TaxID=4109 RepID=A0A9J5ZCQ5_SOLCO|nr:hypothetical protein H5410_021715 [Solanum commersonii]
MSTKENDEGRGKKVLYLEFEGKHGHYLAKKEQKQLKERRNEDMRIAEPIRQVTKRSYPHLLFQCAEP